jgi:FlaG/FlaF family flagellin (archaellin)
MSPGKRSIGLREDRRAVSVTVGYVLTLAVAALLLGTLVTATTGLVTDQSRTVIDDELTVVGDQLAANIDEADRLARVAREDAADSGTDGAVALDVSLPRRVSGSEYFVEIDGGTITLEATNPSVVVEVAYPEPTLDIDAPDRFRGGPIELGYDGGTTLEVRP